MPKKTFTDLWVANIKLSKGERQQVYFDTKERLVLVIGTRAKTFRLVTYTGGKAKTIKLGRYPDLSLKDARQKCARLRRRPKKVCRPIDTRQFSRSCRGVGQTSRRWERVAIQARERTHSEQVHLSEVGRQEVPRHPTRRNQPSAGSGCRPAWSVTGGCGICGSSQYL